MASFQFLVAALVVVLVRESCCQYDGPTDITITPQTLTLMPNVSDSTGGQVTITCRASSTGQERLLAINILRVRHSSPNAEPVEVVGAAIGSEDAVLKDTSLQGATVSGGINTKSITLTMTRAKCNDGGMYTCTATSLDGTQTKSYGASKNVTIQVSPGSITLTADPSGISSWTVNQTLTIRCNGVVGTVEDPANPNVEWVWEYQNVDPNFPIENWQSYSLIGDPQSDINTEPLLAQSPGQCYRSQVSTLTRQLRLDDTNRQYRCYVNNRDVSGQIPSQDYAQVLDVGTVTETGQDAGTGGQGSSTGGAAKADVGAIVGGVIGALIVVIVIIVLVYFLVIRKRRNKDRPDPSKPADEQPPPGYTTGPDPSVTYSQPTSMKNRFKKDDKSRGQTNPGLDNSDEKPPASYDTKPAYDSKPAYESKPARYANDFNDRDYDRNQGRDHDRNQGRRNPGYNNYDDRDRDARRNRSYNSDDGGTDVNTSQASIGYGDPNLGTAI